MISPYGTHFPILAAAVAQTNGPILELGCGHYSTPLLWGMAQPRNRRFVSLERSEEWAALFSKYGTRHVEQWISARRLWLDIDHAWDVIFIDHAPAYQRSLDLALALDVATFVVCHDSEDPRYNYEPEFRKARFRFDWKEYSPWTTVVSNLEPFQWPL